MHKITFIGTVHNENGICNHAELFEILRKIEPEVIFEEIRPSDFELFYNSPSTLESKAVVKYRQYKAPRQIPVDMYEIPQELVSEFRERLGTLFEYVESKSRECWLIKDEIDRNTGQFGFKYLNSMDHAKKWERICDIQDKIVFESDNQDWIYLLKAYRYQQHQRDVVMVRNIYDYCAKNLFNCGVFLVGASHKKGVVKEIGKYSAKNPELTNWSFAYNDQFS